MSASLSSKRDLWKMKKTLFLFIIGFIVFSLFAFDIFLFPPNKSLFKFSRVVIIAEANDIQTSFPIIRAFQSKPYFHMIISLKPGKNKIPLIILKNGKAYRKTLILHYYPSNNYHGDGKKYQFHENEEIQSLCSQCHMTNKIKNNFCLNCHVDKKGDTPYKHEAFDPNDCTACHEEKTQEITVSCYDCHEQKPGRLHSPYANNECLLCHDPHGSSQKSLLLSDIRSLCTQCHLNENYQEFLHPVQRHPMESKNIFCTTCHNAHGSPFSFYFQYAPEVFCGKCHD